MGVGIKVGLMGVGLKGVGIKVGLMGVGLKGVGIKVGLTGVGIRRDRGGVQDAGIIGGNDQQLYPDPHPAVLTFVD